MAPELSVEQIANNSWQAFQAYKRTSLAQRRTFLYAIADELEKIRNLLIELCINETNLTELRLSGELTRTQYQLRSYGDACVQGDWLQATIDTADPQRTPPKLDIRKTLVPLGPVAVFGASNFPFAYSTAGGDTASAFAAGCTVIVKTHNAHKETSMMVASAIKNAIVSCGLPEYVFQTLESDSLLPAQELVKHPLVKAVGFTGSLAGGKALWQIANSRTEPIPVFAEMSSINPIYLLPEKLNADAVNIANAIAASITLGAGQFCTNPGLIIGIKCNSLSEFKNSLSEKIKIAAPQAMLHQGIADNFQKTRAKVLAQNTVEKIAESKSDNPLFDSPTLAVTSAATFLANKELHQEVFGSFSLIVQCENENEMLAIAESMEGQLTTTFWATETDLKTHQSILNAAQFKCGRIIFNGVPTGVEVVKSMQHGGPWPASTDSRFGSVGAHSIVRFARPLSYQNWPNNLLPAELQNENPLGIMRTVNNELTNKAIS